MVLVSDCLETARRSVRNPKGRFGLVEDSDINTDGPSGIGQGQPRTSGGDFGTLGSCPGLRTPSRTKGPHTYSKYDLGLSINNVIRWRAQQTFSSVAEWATANQFNSR
jgi:hypothetical protein